MSSDEKDDHEFRQLTHKEMRKKADRPVLGHFSIADSDSDEHEKYNHDTKRRAHDEYRRGPELCGGSSRKSKKVDDGSNQAECDRRKPEENARANDAKYLRKQKVDTSRSDDRDSQTGSSSSRNRESGNKEAEHRRNWSSDRDRKYHDRHGTHERSQDDRRFQERRRKDQYSSASRRHDRNERDEGDNDRPAWATKAVLKRAEEINKRKLIWSKPEAKEEDEKNVATSTADESRPSTTATWNSILAASSTDDQQLDKFKRLMGMKKGDGKGTDPKLAINNDQIEAERRRQHELYSRLDRQYTIARSITHLGRGQGLGFH